MSGLSANAEVAFGLAAAGLSVFPVGHDKKPLIKGWRDQSTTEATSVANFWRVFPNALVGIDCGKSGLIVIDCDRHGGPDGVEAYNDLVGGEVFEPMVWTPGGGMHVYFRAPGGHSIRNSAGRLAPGIDVRGEGGYVVAPGSTLLDGRSYRSESFEVSRIEALPAVLLERLIPEPPRKTAASAKPLSAPERAYAQAALERASRTVRVSARGTRNAALNKAAFEIGQMAGAGWIDGSRVTAELLAAAYACGLIADDGEAAALATIASGFGKGLDSPHAELQERRRPTPAHPHEPELEALDVNGDAFCFPLINAASLQDKPVPARSWLVPGLVPNRQVTELDGDGGVGKSLLALQLAVCVATGNKWLGRETRSGGAIYLACEDDLAELHGRLRDIAAEHRIELRDLAWLSLVPMAGQDAVLALPPDVKGAPLQHTAALRALVDAIAVHQPSLVVLDTRADLYGGEENNRLQTRQFVTILRHIAIQHDLAVVLLSHPSLAGLASGRGGSGSTAWRNSVRSALLFTRLVNEGGIEADTTLRQLETKKANYGPTGEKVLLRWQSGVFVVDETLSASWIDKKQAVTHAEAQFMELLGQYTAQGRHVSAHPSISYAPAVFAKDPGAKGIRKNAFADAMNRLFHSGKIINATVGTGSRAKQVVAIAEEHRPHSEED